VVIGVGLVRDFGILAKVPHYDKKVVFFEFSFEGDVEKFLSHEWICELSYLDI